MLLASRYSTMGIDDGRVRQEQPGSSSLAFGAGNRAFCCQRGNHMLFLGDHWIDIIAAVVLFFSIVHGWRTGFLVGLFNLLSIPLGIAAAYFFAPGLAKSTGVSLTYMYAIVFFVAVIGVHIVGGMVG